MLKLLRYAIYCFLALGLVVVASYLWVNWRAKDCLYSDVNKIPYRRVAIVLGTSKYLVGGYENEYYQNRIQAAVELYKAKKVDYFIVSGDNRQVNYNEPKLMKEDLTSAGVPADSIQPDYAGFRTLDSVLRMKNVFGHKDYVIISQRFHNQRAVYLARAHGQKPIAFEATGPNTQDTKKVMFREFLARFKAVLDVVTNKQAKFYGDKIEFPPKVTGEASL